MKRALFALVLVALCLPAFGQGPAKVDAVHYRVQVSIEPENHALKGAVEIRLQIAGMTRSVPLELNNRFSVEEITDQAGGRLTVRFDESNSGRVLVSADQPFPVGEQIFHIEYEGVLERESYAFLDKARVVNGYIDDQAAYLMSSARWFPVHDPLFDPATAEVSVTVPVGFSAIVAGVPKPVETEGITETFTWEVARASGPVSLVVARLREYAFTADQTPVHIFLPDRSEEKAAAIFQQVSRALDFFQRSLTRYPFGHVTVVQIPGDVRDEMAGPAVVYLPSDLLRGAEVAEVALARRVALQWWGLGVMPQAPADIILADGFAYYEAAQYLESQNKDAYRDEILKLAVLALKYENRAPISNGSSLGFRSEEYESVVGGKGAWVLYMLEDIIGRENVLAVLREFAAANMGKQATLSQFRSAVSAVGGQDLQWFFGQWVETTGVPEMEVDYTVYKLADGTFRIAGSLKQNLELFRMPLRVAVETKDNEIETTTVQMAGKTTKFEIKSPTRPGRVVLDPDQKLLRNSVDMEVAVHISLGYELFGKNQFLEAIREFERAIKLNPRSSLAHYRLGEVFFEQANTQSAGNAFRDVLNGDLQPKWVEPMSHLYLGQVFDMLGERQRALAEYQKVINAKDNTFDAVTNADKYSQEPFAKKSTVMDQPER